MLSLTKTKPFTGRRLKLIAAGNAGINLLDRIFLEAGGDLEAAAIHTELQALNACAVTDRVLCGERSTRGLGAGGDPALGRQALEESQEKVRAVLEEADAVILLGGLGGGTAGPVLEFLAVEASARSIPVLAVVTLPFSFEGPRRNEEARAALSALRQSAGLVTAFPNEGMSQLGGVGAPVTEAFASADAVLVEVVRGMVEMLRGRGPMEITAHDLLGHVGQTAGDVFFSTASAKGANRANEIGPKLWKSPLSQAGLPAAEVGSLLIHISAGADLTLNEVRTVVDQVRREFEEETLHLHLGLTTSRPEEKSLAVTLVGTTRNLAESTSALKKRETRPVSAPAPLPTPAPEAAPVPEPAASTEPVTALTEASSPVEEMEEASVTHPSAAEEEHQPEEDPVESTVPVSAELDEEETSFESEEEGALPSASEESPTPTPAQAGGFLPNFPQIPSVARPPARPTKKSPIKNRQEVLPLEVAARGRFERSEPTIEEGEDLDVPTFIRQRIKIK
jgi:cell division protein FtsZ